MVSRYEISNDEAIRQYGLNIGFIGALLDTDPSTFVSQLIDPGVSHFVTFIHTPPNQGNDIQK
jgi:hypothetical protein